MEEYEGKEEKIKENNTEWLKKEWKEKTNISSCVLNFRSRQKREHTKKTYEENMKKMKIKRGKEGKYTDTRDKQGTILRIHWPQKSEME